MKNTIFAWFFIIMTINGEGKATFESFEMDYNKCTYQRGAENVTVGPYSEISIVTFCSEKPR